jgi:hypothetical protein
VPHFKAMPKWRQRTQMTGLEMGLVVVIVLLEWQITKLTQRLRNVEAQTSVAAGYMARNAWKEPRKAVASPPPS